MHDKPALSTPRYSVLDIVVLLGIAAGIAFLVGSHRESVMQERFFQHVREMDAPPPAVMLAPDGPKTAGAYRGTDYHLTQDWFSDRAPSWKAALGRYAGKPGLEYLEIGVFEGGATVWMIENILTDPTSHITGLDIFSGDYQDAYGTYKERFLHNVAAAGAAGRTTTIEGFSQVELRKLPLDHYDIIYIDGSHLNADTLEDAVLSFRMLKDGGVLIFDDYGGGLTDPKLGIDAFRRFFGDHYEVIHNGYQLMLTKKAPAPKAA